MPAMADLKGKIVLITGAAGAVGGAVAAAIKAAGGTAVASDLEGRRRHRACARRHRRGRLAARRRRHRARPRPARRAGQCRRHRRARQRRAARLRRLAARARRQSRRHFPRLQIRVSAAAQDKAARSSICRRSRAWSAGTISPPITPRRAASRCCRSRSRSPARAAKPPVRCNAVCPAFLEGPMVDFTVRSARRSGDGACRNWRAAIPLQPSRPAGRSRRALRLSVVGRCELHHRRRSADRRRPDGALERPRPGVRPRQRRPLSPRISAVTCAATERDRPCRS